MAIELIDKSFVRAPKNYIIQSLLATISVGLSIFLMTITDTEHPPTAGTALGIMTHEWSYQTIVFILVCAMCLAIVGRLLRGYLRDLF